jgi:hypothetical protein
MHTQPVLCSRCGATSISGTRFCSRCGNPLTHEKTAAVPETAQAPPPSADLQPKAHQTGQELSWQVNVPLLNDQFIMYDLLKVWGFSTLFMFLIMAAIFIFERNWRGFISMLPLVGLTSLGILVLFLLVMLVFFGNRFPMGFMLGPQGAMVASLSQRGRWGNRLAVILGALAGKPGVAGAGLLGMARETVGVTWDEVRRLNIHPETRVISLMDSWHVVLRLYCTPQNYDQVLMAVQKFAARGIQKGAAPRPRGLSPNLKLGLKSILALVAAFLITALPLEVPPVFIWLLLAGGLGAIWFLAFDRFFGIVSLLLAGVILVGFVSQGLEVQQRTNPEEFRTFARSQGVQIDEVPDWIIGKYRRYELFHAHKWIQTGIAALGLSFFVWVGVSALQPRRRAGSKKARPPGESS